MKAVRFLRAALFGGGVLLLLSCADRSPLGVDSRAAQPQAGLLGFMLPLPNVGLLTCTPLPFDSVTETIGPEGGTLAVGGHMLTVPAGALDSAVSITAVAPSDTVNHVRFQPEGLTFQQPASLTLSYANCNLLGSLAPKRIAYTTDSFAILEFLPSLDDLLSQTVTASLHHFSEYAIAW
jgi:hypothetical protein